MLSLIWRIFDFSQLWVYIYNWIKYFFLAMLFLIWIYNTNLLPCALLLKYVRGDILLSRAC